MSDSIKRYDLTYRNDFNDVYQADRDEADDGEYVTYEDHAAIVADLVYTRPLPPVAGEVGMTDAAIDEIAREHDLYSIQDNGRVSGDDLRGFARAILKAAGAK